jgi:circadian clock protein KaiC
MTDSDRVISAIEGLDHVLRGGFPVDRLYLVEGDPGTGKTTLALQFLLEGVRRGEAALYVTLSETHDELRAVAESHGWSLTGITIHELGADETLRPGSQYTAFHPSEVELGDTMNTVFQLLDRVRPQRVVFDSLSEMRLLARDPLRYRRQILALKQFFIGRRCTVLLLDDRTAEGGDLQLQSLAHGVVRLEQLAPDYGGSRRRLRIVKLRGVNFVHGFHDFTIETGGVQVYPRLVASEHHEAFVPTMMSSGLPAFDRLLGGGLAPGTTTLFLGPAGSGKTLLAAHFAVEAGRTGHAAALFAFDEGRGTLMAGARGIGLDLQGQVDAGLATVQQIDPAEVSPGEFVSLVRAAVERRGARVVVIDSLNGYVNAMPEERSLTAHLHELATYLRQRGVVTIILMAQHGLIGAMQSSVDVSYLADSVVLTRFFEAQGSVRKAISVVKKRASGHEDTIREFRITAGGIRIGEPLQSFRGILTGVPEYDPSQLLRLEDDGGRAAD